MLTYLSLSIVCLSKPLTVPDVSRCHTKQPKYLVDQSISYRPRCSTSSYTALWTWWGQSALPCKTGVTYTLSSHTNSYVFLWVGCTLNAHAVQYGKVVPETKHFRELLGMKHLWQPHLATELWKEPRRKRVIYLFNYLITLHIRNIFYLSV